MQPPAALIRRGILSCPASAMAASPGNRARIDPERNAGSGATAGLRSQDRDKVSHRLNKGSATSSYQMRN